MVFTLLSIVVHNILSIGVFAFFLKQFWPMIRRRYWTRFDLILVISIGSTGILNKEVKFGMLVSLYNNPAN
ncbi:protein of unknown function [Magnetospira sp. QH-2]|nr:protein of unknown function [Magnetospira sp. QH-2]